MQLATTIKATPDSRKLPRPWQALASHSASAVPIRFVKMGRMRFFWNFFEKNGKIVKFDVGKLETDFCDKKILWNYSGTWKQWSTHCTLVFVFPQPHWFLCLKCNDHLIPLKDFGPSTSKSISHFPPPFFSHPTCPKPISYSQPNPTNPTPTLLPNRVLAAFCASLCNSRTKAPAPSARVKPLADSSKVLQRPSGDKAIPILQKPTSKGSKVSKFCRKFWEKVQGKYISQILCLDLFWR